MMRFDFPKPCLAADQSISGLERAERSVLAALRLYVARLRHPGDGEVPGWWKCFDDLPDATTAVRSFDALLRLVGTSATIPLDVRCPACPTLGDGEVRLLEIVARAQSGNVDLAETAVAAILPVAAARCGRGALLAFAASLAAGGLGLPARAGRAPEAAAPPHRCPDRGARLIH